MLCKTDGSSWRVLTKRGPLEKEIASYSSILSWRTPWTVWKGNTGRWGPQVRRCLICRWLDSITDSMDMNLSKLQETVKDWNATVRGVAKSQTQLSDWMTTTNGIFGLKIENSLLKWCLFTMAAEHHRTQSLTVRGLLLRSPHLKDVIELRCTINCHTGQGNWIIFFLHNPKVGRK